jgi:hypothetical protein
MHFAVYGLPDFGNGFHAKHELRNLRADRRELGFDIGGNRRPRDVDKLPIDCGVVNR